MAQTSFYETERLILRPTNLEDAAFIYELLNSPKWKQYIGNRNVHNKEDARRYILVKMLPQLHQFGFSNYTLLKKCDKTKIGTCGLYNRDGLEDFDIGFAFLPDFEKQGYAIEAASKMLDLAFNEFNLTTVCAITTKENLSSQKLLKKLGLNHVGNTTLPDDDNEGLLLYKIHKNMT